VLVINFFKTFICLVYFLQILSRGVVYESKVIDTQGQHLVTFDVAVTPKMAPTAHMMAYYVRPDMEIVPDSMAFNIEGIFENEVGTPETFAINRLVLTTTNTCMAIKMHFENTVLIVVIIF